MTSASDLEEGFRVMLRTATWKPSFHGRDAPEIPSISFIYSSTPHIPNLLLSAFPAAFSRVKAGSDVVGNRNLPPRRQPGARFIPGFASVRTDEPRCLGPFRTDGGRLPRQRRSDPEGAAFGVLFRRQPAFRPTISAVWSRNRRVRQGRKEYIRLKLIDGVKKGLHDPGRSIAQVDGELGFRYPQHFLRFFKRQPCRAAHVYRVAKLRQGDVAQDENRRRKIGFHLRVVRSVKFYRCRLHGIVVWRLKVVVYGRRSPSCRGLRVDVSVPSSCRVCNRSLSPSRGQRIVTVVVPGFRSRCLRPLSPLPGAWEIPR